METPRIPEPRHIITLYLFHWKEFLDTVLPTLPDRTIFLITYLGSVVSCFEKFEIKFIAGNTYFFSQWFEILFASLLLGVLFAFFFYWINGWIIQLGVILSGGKKNGPLTRKLMVLSTMPLIIPSILFILLKVIFLQHIDVHDPLYMMLIRQSAMISLPLYIYSWYLLLSGVIHLFHTSVKRTLLVFIGIPFALLLFAATTLFTTFVSNLS